MEIRQFLGSKISTKWFLALVLFASSISGAPNNPSKHNQVTRAFHEVIGSIKSNFKPECVKPIENCVFQIQLPSQIKRNLNDQLSVADQQYCEPFWIANYCVDEYMRFSGVDEYERGQNKKCVNGEHVKHFKQSIYRNQCNQAVSNLRVNIFFFKLMFITLISYQLFF